VSAAYACCYLPGVHQKHHQNTLLYTLIGTRMRTLIVLLCAWVHGLQGQTAGLTSSPFSKDTAAQEYIVQGVAGLCDAKESFRLVDGPAASALFYKPSAAISVGPNAVLVADRRNNLIRRVAAGWVQTFSGSDFGYADGNRDLAAPAYTLACLCCGASEH